MKILHIESKLKNIESELSKKEIAKLPKKLLLLYTIQYKDLAIAIRKQLVNNNITVSKFQQVLGCSKLKTDLPVFLIGNGRFHAINIYLQCADVYLLEGFKIIKIPKKEIEEIKIKRKTALMKFLSADKIGILVSTKPGQENLKKAVELKRKLKRKGKEVHVFVCNNIDLNQLENFDIQSWVNTACPNIANDDFGIINFDELPENEI